MRRKGLEGTGVKLYLQPVFGSKLVVCRLQLEFTVLGLFHFFSPLQCREDKTALSTLSSTGGGVLFLWLVAQVIDDTTSTYGYWGVRFGVYFRLVL